jgi:hypothetical protein
VGITSPARRFRVGPRLPGANFFGEVVSARMGEDDARVGLPCRRIALLLFGVSSLRAQTLDLVPGFLQDIAGQTPLPARVQP